MVRFTITFLFSLGRFRNVYDQLLWPLIIMTVGKISTRRLYLEIKKKGKCFGMKKIKNISLIDIIIHSARASHIYKLAAGTVLLK